MRALVLCAGYGSRLGDLTQSLPKPMLEVGGKPILEHIVHHLYSFGVREVVVNTHHLPVSIMKYFGTSLLYTYEPFLLGEQGTIDTIIRNFPTFGKEYLLVANGDTLTNLDINAMFAMSGGHSVQYVDGDVYAGTKILSPAYLSGIDTKISDYQSADSFWIDAGTPSGLERARKLYEKTTSPVS